MLREPDNLTESEQLFSGQANFDLALFNYRNVRYKIASSAFTNFNIYESLFDDNVVHGDVTILDSAGFEERVPIIGEETIEIEFQNARMTRTKYFGKFIVYKMSEKIIQGKQQLYTLYFICLNIKNLCC